MAVGLGERVSAPLIYRTTERSVCLVSTSPCQNFLCSRNLQCHSLNVSCTCVLRCFATSNYSHKNFGKKLTSVASDFTESNWNCIVRIQRRLFFHVKSFRERKKKFERLWIFFFPFPLALGETQQSSSSQCHFLFCDFIVDFIQSFFFFRAFKLVYNKPEMWQLLFCRVNRLTSTGVVWMCWCSFGAYVHQCVDKLVGIELRTGWATVSVWDAARSDATLCLSSCAQCSLLTSQYTLRATQQTHTRIIENKNVSAYAGVLVADRWARARVCVCEIRVHIGFFFVFHMHSDFCFVLFFGSCCRGVCVCARKWVCL